jgi:hypothetical protein
MKNGAGLRDPQIFCDWVAFYVSYRRGALQTGRRLPL